MTNVKIFAYLPFCKIDISTFLYISLDSSDTPILKRLLNNAIKIS